MKMRRLTAAALSTVFFLAMFDSAGAQPRIIGSAMFDACAVALTESGDTFASEYLVPGGDFRQKPWTPVGNLFVAAGSGGASPLIGITFANRAGPVYAFARNGDFYTLEYCGGVTAHLEGNVFDQAGISSGGRELSTIGWNGGLNGRHIFAADGNGNVYRKDTSGALSPLWEFVGNPLDQPTKQHQNSWGFLKVRYH